jgi:hypothetical protein
MKTTVALSFAALFYLVSAFPLSLRQANQANIVVQTGDSDSSISFNIDLNKIVPTSQSGGSSGVDASVSPPGITCQAFTDAAGTTPLNNSFTSAATLFFNQCAANGQATSCVLADAVNIGAFCCAEDATFKANCLANAQSSSSSSGVVTNITVQLQGAGELAIQESVSDDGSVVVVSGNQSFDSAFIVNGASGVSCQAFSDVKGTQKIGSAFGSMDTSLNGGKETLVQALSCKAN